MKILGYKIFISDVEYSNFMFSKFRNFLIKLRLLKYQNFETLKFEKIWKKYMKFEKQSSKTRILKAQPYFIILILKTLVSKLWFSNFVRLRIQEIHNFINECWYENNRILELYNKKRHIILKINILTRYQLGLGTKIL